MGPGPAGPPPKARTEGSFVPLASPSPRQPPREGGWRKKVRKKSERARPPPRPLSAKAAAPQPPTAGCGRGGAARKGLG